MAVTAGSVPSKRGTNPVLKYLKSKWFAYACIAPIMVATAALVYYPLVLGIYYSFTNATSANVASQILQKPATYVVVGLKNYITIIHDPLFGSLMWQTFLWIFFNIIFHFVIGLGMALLLNQKIRFRAVYRALLIVPWATPQAVASYGWLYMFNSENGFINNLLGVFHIPAVSWTSAQGWSLTACIITNVWLGIPLVTITLLGGLQSIPSELYEVANLDGANWWQRFWNITLPMLRPVAILITILDVIWTFNIFVVIYVITGGGPYNTSDTIVTRAFEIAIQAQPQNFSLGAAYGVVILLILAVFVLVYSRLLRANEQVY